MQSNRASCVGSAGITGESCAHEGAAAPHPPPPTLLLAAPAARLAEAEDVDNVGRRHAAVPPRRPRRVVAKRKVFIRVVKHQPGPSRAAQLRCTLHLLPRHEHACGRAHGRSKTCLCAPAARPAQPPLCLRVCESTAPLGYRPPHAERLGKMQSCSAAWQPTGGVAGVGDHDELGRPWPCQLSGQPVKVRMSAALTAGPKDDVLAATCHLQRHVMVEVEGAAGRGRERKAAGGGVTGTACAPPAGVQSPARQRHLLVLGAGIAVTVQARSSEPHAFGLRQGEIAGGMACARGRVVQALHAEAHT